MQLAIRILTLSAIFLLVQLPVRGQAPDPVPPVLVQTADADLTVRMQGFYALRKLAPSNLPNLSSQIPALLSMYPSDAQAIKQSLVALLTRELTDPSFGSLTSSPEDETGVDFSLDLIEAIASLHDPQTIAVLVRVIDSGAMVTDTLASFGPDALDSVTQTVYSTDLQKRHAGAYTLMTMLSPAYSALFSDAVSQSKIQAALTIAIASFKAPYAGLGALFKPVVDTLPHREKADLNGDGRVDGRDLDVVLDAFDSRVGQFRFDVRADVNADGRVSIVDLILEWRAISHEDRCGRWNSWHRRGSGNFDEFERECKQSRRGT
jgi:hypothetical protein